MGNNEVHRQLPPAPLIVLRRCMILVPRPLPTAPLVVRCRYLVVVPRPLSAPPFVVRRTYLVVVHRLRNYDRILELKGGNFYDVSRGAKS